MSEEELDDLSMPEEIGETDSQDEMYEHFSVTVDKGQGMLRIDKFLTNRMEDVSRNRIQAAADAGNILVGGTPVKSSYKVKPLDRISIVMPYPLRELEIVPENIPLDIRYEDDDLIIVNKPAGMVVHPGHGNYTGTLVNALTSRICRCFRAGTCEPGSSTASTRTRRAFWSSRRTSGRTPGWPSSFSTIRSTGSTTRWYGATWSPTKAP